MAYKFQVGAAVLSGAVDQEGEVTVMDNNKNIKVSLETTGDMSGSGDFQFGGTSFRADNLGAIGTIAQASDFVMLYDADTNKMQKNSFATFLGAIDGNGLEVSSHQLAIDLDGSSLSVGASGLKIADDGVGTDQIADNAVTLAKMAGLARGKIIYGDASGDPAALAAGGNGKLLVADANGDLSWTTVGGDATLSAGDLTISAGVVEASMLNSNVVSASSGLELTAGGLRLSASAAGPGLAFIESGVLEINIDNLSNYGAQTMHQTQDHFLMSDNGTEKKVTFSDLEDSIFANVSSQASIAAGGALSLNVAAITSQTEMTGDVEDTDELMINDGSALKRLDFSVLRDAVFNDVSGDATINAGGALAIAGSAVHGSMINSDAAGVGLAYSSNSLALDLNELGGEVVDITADSIAFVDGSDNSTKKEELAHLIAAMAGAGLTQNGTTKKLDVQGNAVALKADGDTLAEGYNYFADIGGGGSSATVTLPDGGADKVGDVVTVKAGNLDVASGKTITIQRAGSDVLDGGRNSVVLESPFAAITFVVVADGQWRIV